MKVFLLQKRASKALILPTLWYFFYFWFSPRGKRKIKWQDLAPHMFVYDKRNKPNFPEFPNYFFFSPYCNILSLDNRIALPESIWPIHTGAIKFKTNKQTNLKICS